MEPANSIHFPLIARKKEKHHSRRQVSSSLTQATVQRKHGCERRVMKLAEFDDSVGQA